MAGTDVFHYSPLNESSTSFRLLRILPKRNSYIECKLQHDDISDCAPYEALSYTWGIDEKVEPITVNGNILWVTDNLYTALQHLALPEQDRLIWIDGICINQNDDAEKSQQVQRMSNIYIQATRVIFWLGKATSEIRVLMKCLARLQALMVDNYTLEQARALWPSLFEAQEREKATVGLRTLLRRPWFRRVWILQEVANARRGLLCAGVMSVSAGVFALSTSLLELEHSDAETYWQPVIDIMPGLLRKHSWWAEKPDLYTLMQRYRDSNATDPRDRIYALLGLSQTQRDRDTVVVDYAKPLHEAFENALRYFMRSERSRIDDVLNIAKDVPGVGTILVVVQDEAATDIDFFDCQQRTTKTDSDYSWWLRSRTVGDPTNFFSDQYSDGTFTAPQLQHVPFVAICKRNAHIYMQPLRAASSGASESSLYSEIVSIFEDNEKIYDSDVYFGRPDIGHWGSQDSHVKLVVLEEALAARVLEFAAGRGLVNLLQLVLDLELVERQDALQSDVVYNTAKAGGEAMLNVVLDMGFDPNACGDYGTPLQRAARNGDIGIMKILIERGANVNAGSSDDRNALSEAISEFQPAAFNLLVEKGADCKTNGRALIEAYDDDREWALRSMLLSGANPNVALYLNMLSHQHTNAIIMTIDHGANPNLLASPNLLAKSLGKLDMAFNGYKYIGQSMLQIAAQRPSHRRPTTAMDVMKALLDRGADLNLVSNHDTIKTSLHAALYERHIDSVTFLLERGAHIDLRAYEVIAEQQSRWNDGFEASYQKLLKLLHRYDSSRKDYEAPTKQQYVEDRAPGGFSEIDMLAANELIFWAEKRKSMNTDTIQ